MKTTDLHCGRILAPNERALFEAAPSLRHLVIAVFHLRPVLSYFVLMAGLTLGRALGGHVPYWAALMPLVCGALVAGLVFLAANAIRRTSRYLITERRVVLRYGLVFPRALSLPFAQIASMAVAMEDDGHGVIALALHRPNRIPYLKLWPHARPWHIRSPQPMLRGLDQAGMAAAILARHLAEAEQERNATPVAAGQSVAA